MKLSLRISFWAFVLAILVSLIGIVSNAFSAESYKDQLREYKQVYNEMLRVKISKIPKHTTVQLDLKNGKVVRGTLEGFLDDGIWIMPLGKRWLLDKEAFDVRELFDINIIVVRQI